MAYLQIWFKAIVQPAIDWVGSLGTDLAAVAADTRVWLALIVALVMGGTAIAVGVAVARLSELLDERAPRSETLGVGLGLGLLILSATWAAIRSGGQSSSTPIAIAALIGLAAAVRYRVRQRPVARPQVVSISRAVSGWGRTLAVGALAVVAFGLVYGTTVELSPRDGRQPLESADMAFYAIQGAHLATTGREDPFSSGGFNNIPTLPEQSWYHWGEGWLTAAAVGGSGVEAIPAHYYAVLPLTLLALAALTATLFRRLTGSGSRAWFTAAALSAIVIAPMPLILGPFFGWWARGSLFEIAQYGLAPLIAVILALGYLARPERPSTAWFVVMAWLAADLLVTHIVVAVVGAFGVAVAVLIVAVGRLRSGRRIAVPSWVVRLIAAIVATAAATLAWGVATGHALPTTGLSRGIGPFGGYWVPAVLATFASGGVFLVLPIAGRITRAEDQRVPPGPLFIAAFAAMVAGAVIWGARIGDYNTFHAFFGAILVFGTPVTIAAIWIVAARARSSGHAPIGTVLAGLVVLQIAVGTLGAIQRLRHFGASAGNDVPVSLLAAARALPADAVLAYACLPEHEVSPWEPSLIAIEAHTGRRLVPMCFEADVLTELNGGRADERGNPFFGVAPQRALYPDGNARPGSDEVATFLIDHGIGYIYADDVHPNTLVDAAVPLAASGRSVILSIP